MRMLMVLLLSFSPRIHAHSDLDFDRWHFAELVVQGLQASARGDQETTQVTLGQIQTLLAELNSELNRRHPRDREFGLTVARDVLYGSIRDAWRLEQVKGAKDRQTRFLERVIRAGSTENIAAKTAELAKHAQEDLTSLRDKQWLGIFGAGAVPLSLGGYFAIAMSHPGPFIFGMIGAGIVGGIGSAVSAAMNAEENFSSKINFVNPVFRECELRLLRGVEGAPGRETEDD